MSSNQEKSESGGREPGVSLTLAKAFESWTYNALRFLAIPVSAGWHVVDECGNNYGSWVTVERFRDLQRAKDTMALAFPQSCADLSVRIRAISPSGGFTMNPPISASGSGVGHTPLPWFTQDTGWGDGCLHIESLDGSICDGRAARGGAVKAADAELIVRAVNSHAALLEACKAALTQMPTGTYTPAQEAGQTALVVRAQLRSALKLATKGTP